MKPEEASKVIFDQINKQIDAKLLPITQLIMGLELSISVIFDLLHKKGALSRSEALEALQKTQERNSEVAPEVALMVLKHISGMLEGMNENDPLVRRSLFEVLEQSQTDTDENDPQE